jgi:hypothetical protein
MVALVGNSWNQLILEIKQWQEMGKQVGEPIILS